MSILFLYGHLLVGDQLLILFGLSVTFACLPLGVCVCVCVCVCVYACARKKKSEW